MDNLLNAKLQSIIDSLYNVDNEILPDEIVDNALYEYIIDIIDNTKNEKVGRFVAFVYQDKTTNLFSLQILKVEIYPKYRGGCIMRKFYIDFNQWLKDNFENFDMFTSDFIFLYKEKCRKKYQ